MSVLDDYLVDPKLSLLDKTRIQAQVLVPVLRALRSELGKEKADVLVKQALRDWSKQLFAAVGSGVDGSPRRKWAAMQSTTAASTMVPWSVSIGLRPISTGIHPSSGRKGRVPLPAILIRDVQRTKFVDVDGCADSAPARASRSVGRAAHSLNKRTSVRPAH